MAGQPCAWARAAGVALPAAAFLYILLFRTWGITHHFWLFTDQIRDWRIALGSLTDLPLVGPPQHAGGYALGPVFYWVLWLTRVTVGPFFDNLPHAGGIGLSILQSAADVFLLVAIWRKFGSPWLALAVVLLVASAPYDAALTATIWNPIVAEALAKSTAALVLLGWPRRSPWKAALLAAIAWLAFQAHITGVFVAASVFAWIVGEPILARRSREAVRAAVAIAAVVLALQIPYFAFRAAHPSPAVGASPVLESVLQVVRDPRSLRLAGSGESFTRALNLVQLEPWRVWWIGWFLATCALIVVVKHRRDPATLVATVLPLAATCAGFAVWVGEYDHYFYLTVLPSAVLTAGLAVMALVPRRFGLVAGLALVVLAVAVQPARFRASRGIHRLPEYAALVRASDAVARRGQPIRELQAEFLPPGCDPSLLVEILGGRIERGAVWYAVVSRDGGVRYHPVESK